jgi:predicted N-formylglutamate amidohydrolase
MKDSAVFDLLNPRGHSSLVLTCEHASCVVPEEYRNLGVSE